MADISKTQREALAELARGPLVYSVAGWHLSFETGKYFSTQTMDALAKRALVRFTDRAKPRLANVTITPKGRALAKELGL